MTVSGDRLGLERHRADQAELLGERFDPDLARPQDALELLPGERLEQQAARIEHQIAAVGAVQRAGLDQVEVGDQRAELGDVLDPAHQVRMRRVVLVDHRCALGPGMIDQEIDPVAPKRINLGDRRTTGCRGRQDRLRRRRARRLIGGLGEVALDRIEVGEHIRKVFVVLAQLVDQVPDGVRRDLAVQLL